MKSLFFWLLLFFPIILVAQIDSTVVNGWHYVSHTNEVTTYSSLIKPYGIHRFYQEVNIVSSLNGKVVIEKDLLNPLQGTGNFIVWNRTVSLNGSQSRVFVDYYVRRIPTLEWQYVGGVELQSGDPWSSHQYSGVYSGLFRYLKIEFEIAATPPQTPINLKAGFDYWYVADQINSFLRMIDDFGDSLTSVHQSQELAREYNLLQNYPNPFNPQTTIKFSILGNELVILKVYNILGEEVRVLVNEKLKAGNYEVNFNAPSLPSGAYTYQMTAGTYTETREMFLIK